MVKLKIRQLAESKGITTAYQLQKAANVLPTTASKWFKNQMKSISLETIDLLCKLFNCSPADLFEFTEE